MAKNVTSGKATYRLRQLIAMALLAAMSIVLGKFLQIPIGNSIRISFENLPILFAAYVFGPLGGGAVALVEDVIGGLIVFGEVNPIITAGAVAVGLVSGLLFRAVKGRDGEGIGYVRCAVSVLLAHALGSMLIKSFGLWLFYRTAVPVLLLRVPVYIVTGAAESAVLCLLMANSAVRAALRTFLKANN